MNERPISFEEICATYEYDMAGAHVEIAMGTFLTVRGRCEKITFHPDGRPQLIKIVKPKKWIPNESDWVRTQAKEMEVEPLNITEETSHARITSSGVIYFKSPQHIIIIFPKRYTRSRKPLTPSRTSRLQGEKVSVY